MKFSIIIPNYNYGQFVGKAIQSALDVDWPDIEVIVVDDGSTDNSRAVIETFGTRITAIFQTNSTHRVACNMGFARSTGDAVIFLDSDDILLPSVAAEVAAVWTEQVSKVQFQMMRVDVNGDPIGRIFPKYDRMPTPEAVRHWAEETTAYPTPPGSGNAYARKFLEKLFPLDDSCGAFCDSACLAAAPFLGDVITIAKPFALYRRHADNDSNLLSDPCRFSREVARAEARWRFACRTAGLVGIQLNEQNLFKSMDLLQLRVASLRVSPDLHPLTNDSRKRAMYDTFQAIWHFPAASLKYRMIIGMWAILTLLAPKKVAIHLITLRFKPT